MKTSILGLEELHFIRLVLSTNETNVFIAYSLEHGEECIMSKYRLKKDANELQEYLQFRRRGSRVEAKKGKGAKYNRGREKDKARKQENE